MDRHSYLASRPHYGRSPRAPAILETAEAILVVDRTDPNYARTLAHGVLAWVSNLLDSCPEVTHAATRILREDMGYGSSSTHGVRFQAWRPSYLSSS